MDISSDEREPIPGGSLRWFAVTLVRNLKWTSITSLSAVALTLPLAVVAVGLPFTGTWDAYVLFTLFLTLQGSRVFVRYDISFTVPEYNTPGRERLNINEEDIGEWRRIFPMLVGGTVFLGAIIIGLAVLASVFLSPYALILVPFAGLAFEGWLSRTRNQSLTVPGIEATASIIEQLADHSSRERFEHTQRVKVAKALLRVGVSGHFPAS